MFNGSENYDDDYFRPLRPRRRHRHERHDQRGPHQLLPERAHLGARHGAVDGVGPHGPSARGHRPGEARRAARRGAEREAAGREPALRQVFRQLITEHIYPEGHPYSWTVIGSMEDLDAASLEDVHEWFKTYYGAANAVLAVAGDIDAETAQEKVEHYFGDIPSGRRWRSPQAWVAKRDGEPPAVIQDRVPQARVYKVWNMPEFGSADARLPGAGRPTCWPRARPRGSTSAWSTRSRSPRTSRPSS